MAVLPWGHSRTRAESNGEKQKAGAGLDWFSRSTAEPSRQAISDLMKQHSRASSGGSGSLRSRSRASTPSSQKTQFRSATPVTAVGGPSGRSSMTHSRPSTPVRPSTSGPEQSESTTKSLFQRGGLLRRKGSKMGLLTEVEPEPTVVSPTRSSSLRTASRGRESPLPAKSENIRSSISKPFDFAHVMHADLTRFSGLGRIDESELALQFDAIQERYRTASTPEELQVQDSDSTTSVKDDVADSSIAEPKVPPPALPPSMQLPPLPRTPKPIVTRTLPDVRPSRSTENFSRPTPRSPTTPSANFLFRPSLANEQALPPVPSLETPIDLDVKPLPQLPTVVHAVSTQDDTARLLMSAPLPPPPPPPPAPSRSGASTPRHQRQSSSKGSLRHMSTFPSSRNPQAFGSTIEGGLGGICEEDALPRPHSDHQLVQRSRHRSSSKRPSTRKNGASADEWDDAIDSAWDVETDKDMVDQHDLQRSASLQSRTGESFLTIEQPLQESISSPSTPLMTMSPPRKTQQVTAGCEGSSLFGLGIETGVVDEISGAVHHGSESQASEITASNGRRLNASPRLPRSAYSAISNASSQESIILSIASSIMGTQRSSVSSVSISDYAHLPKPDRASSQCSIDSPLLGFDLSKAARPESTCLPPALLQQMHTENKKSSQLESGWLPSASPQHLNVEFSKPARPESGCLPSPSLQHVNTDLSKAARPESGCLPPSSVQYLNAEMKRASRPESGCLASPMMQHLNVNVTKAARPESGCLPPALMQQMNAGIKEASRTSSYLNVVSNVTASSDAMSDRPESMCLPPGMLATFPMPETKSQKQSDVEAAAEELEEDSVSSLPSEKRHMRSSHGSRISVPRRSSSISNNDMVHTGRSRSNTATSRTRPSRGSYSLFPNAASAAASPPPILDIEGVAS